MSTVNSKVQSALIEIQNLGLDKIRCYLTGAPYATLATEEIVHSLESELDNDPSATIDNLVDSWQLKALTFNTQLLPMLRGVKEKSLVRFMRDGHNGQVKALGYLVTRLLYPHLGAEPLHTEVARERMLFATHLYDTATKWEPLRVAGLVQQLVVVDSYCSMPYWHTLWAFESSLSKLGIQKAPKRIQETFADPLRVTEDVTRLDEVIKYLYELMLFVTERDGVAGKSGNRMAQQIMLIVARHIPKQVIPHFQKQLSPADIQRMEDRRRLDSRNELRVAHSAIHGKKTPINYHDNPLWQMAQGLKSNVKKANESKPKAEPKPKKTTQIDPKFMAAFNALMKPKGN